MSVPYALFASDFPIKISDSGDTLFLGNQKIQVSGISNSKKNGPELIDVDGNVYQTIKIGTQVWMKENLRAGKYRNGDPIVSGLPYSTWISTTIGATDIYGGNGKYLATYGNLYNWYATIDPRGLCPVDWHVPTNDDWNQLSDFLGGDNVAGLKLKSTSSLWTQSEFISADNSSGFSGLPAGVKAFGNFDFPYSSVRGTTHFWTSSSDYSIYAKYRSLSATVTILEGRSLSYDKKYGFSVRCLKD